MPIPYKKIHGFTLLELMVAMSIFAIVSLLTIGGLNNILNTQEHTEKNMQRLIRFQMAFTIISREIQQAILRPIRDEYGTVSDSINSETSDDIKGLEFTHQGRFNLGDTVSLQRVAYYQEDKKLIKKVWQVLDRVEDTKPVKQIILDDLEEVNFYFYSINRSETSSNEGFVGDIIWQDSLNKDNDSQLRAIKISFKSKDYEELYRVFEIVQ